MYAPDLSKATNGLKEEEDDSPSVLGRFLWTVVGNSCIPCLLKKDGTKYVPVRMAESNVLAHFLFRLNAEVFNCVSVKSFGITEAEMKLLNEINAKHCEFSFGRDPFSMDTDVIVNLDDLIEFYHFLDTCYNKLVNQIPSRSKNKCGFVLLNNHSFVPYVLKDNQKYVPLFFFEGETESLKTKAINLENWDLAYLKFCCKVQGIKNELFASKQCLVISLEDVKSYFPEGTKFDDYWPSQFVSTKNDLKGNHSWVQTPHIDSSAVVSQTPVPNATHPLANKTAQSALVKQLHNQRANSNPVINSAPMPTYAQPNSWSSSVVGNNMNSVQSGPYQIAQVQQRIAPKQTLMNAKNVVSRTYSNQSGRPQQQCYATSNNFPNIPVTQQTPPPPVKVHSSPMSNMYPSTITATSGYVSMYSAAPVYTLPNSQSHHKNSTSTAQRANKVRSNLPNQTAPNTRYPPALTPISSAVIQPNAVVGNVPSNNSALMLGNRNRTSYSLSGGDEIIDLSSPPHSPQPSNSININNVASSASVGSYVKTNNSTLGKIIKIAEVVNSINSNPYEIKPVMACEKSVAGINLAPHNFGKMALTLHTLHNNYFPKMETRELKVTLLNVLKCDLYKGNSMQFQLLQEDHKHFTNEDDFLLIKLDDFTRFHKHLTYIVQVEYLNPLKHGGSDPKRPKLSQDRALASYPSDWPFNIRVIPTGQPNQAQSISTLPLKQELHSPTYRNSGVSPSPNSSVYTYDLNYNNNSNDWLNTGSNKYVRHEAVPPSSSTTFPNSSVCTYDLNYNNNSNDWLNAGSNKYVRHEAVPPSSSTTFPNSSVCTYDLNYNNNSNDWLNAGSNKYVRHEAVPPSSSTTFPNSSVCTYDLNYNNNSNDWLNAGSNKYVRHEAVPPSSSTTLWSSNPLNLPQTTIVDAAWAYANHNF